MRLPNSAHTARPWRIHELTRDFDLEDVWALPTPGGPDDFAKLVDGFATLATSDAASPRPGVVAIAATMLFAIRWKLGAWFGWDDPDDGLDERVPSLRDRLPDDLREAPAGPDRPPFAAVYRLDNEWAGEIANRTVHGVIHLSWVRDGPDVGDGVDSHHGQMAVYAKPNGRLGSAYMLVIRPFRHLLVYPALLGSIEQGWPTIVASAASEERG